jgi:hypothetical protein
LKRADVYFPIGNFFLGNLLKHHMTRMAAMPKKLAGTCGAVYRALRMGNVVGLLVVACSVDAVIWLACFNFWVVADAAGDDSRRSQQEEDDCNHHLQ